jgi:Ca2+-binding RTX toxin-like protein
MSILTVGPTSTYPTIAAALAAANSGDTILLEAGYSNEAVTVTTSGITIDGSATSTGIVVQLDAGVTGLTLAGTAPINVLDSSSGGSTIAGNDGDNEITVSGGIDVVSGGGGTDRLVVDYSTAAGTTVGDSTTGFIGTGVGSVTIGTGFEHFTIMAGMGVNTITTGAGDDIITTSNTVANTIVAGEGNNIIITGSGVDTITTGFGNDKILAGEGASTITDTGGDNFIVTGSDVDTILVGAGNDSIFGGDGANTITGTAGDKIIVTGAGADTITLTSGNNIIQTGDGASTIVATSGDNMICTGDGVDTISVGGGNNIIEAGDGANTITATSGSNIIFGGSGVDTITVGGGGNYIDGGNGANTLTSGGGNDTIVSGVEADTIATGAGDDKIVITGGADVIDAAAGFDTLVVDYSAATGAVITSVPAGILSTGYAGTISGMGAVTYAGIENFDITTGSGDDSITTGDGDDTINSGTGIDQITAGAGSDYIYGNVGDVIDGGEGGTDSDTLNLYGTGSYTIAYDANPENGVVTFLGGGGFSAGTLTFTNIENIVNVAPLPPTVVILTPDPALCTPIVPCFTLGTMISTSTGPRLIETLKKGDLVSTRDNGFQPIVWIGTKELSGALLSEDDSLQPISIRRDALGNDCPNRDMIVSRQHRMLLCGERAELLFGTNEVLVRALHLTSLPGVDAMVLASVTYVHIMFDRHEIVQADGAWSESFQPGDRTLSGMDADQRQELDTIFPELCAQDRFANYDAARMTLKSCEARVYLAA